MSNLLNLEEERPSTGEYDNTPMGADPQWAARIKNGANWFYWIAALSLVNSAAFVVGSPFHFLAGLGLTELADGIIEASIQQGAPAAVKAFSIVFDLVLVAGFALAGYFANKYWRTAFIIGIIVYVFDGLIVLLLGSYFMAAFHAFALYGIVRGFLACREWCSYEAANAVSHMLPPPPPTSLTNEA